MKWTEFLFAMHGVNPEYENHCIAFRCFSPVYNAPMRCVSDLLAQDSTLNKHPRDRQQMYPFLIAVFVLHGTLPYVSK
jgi:hypothetical protein